MLQKSNYQILYFPNDKASGYGFTIRLKEEFRDFARFQDVNQELYEQETIRLIKFFTDIDWNEVSKQHGGLCCFDGGLLWKIKIPGNAAGISLENRNQDEPYYTSHNIDSPYQTGILLGILSRYLFDIEGRIEESI